MNPDDVKSILADAVKAVTDAKVPDDLKSVAFEKAVGLLAARITPQTAALSAEGETASAVPISVGPQLDRLAARLGLSNDVVERVFAEGREGLQVNVRPERLSRGKSAGARELAMLVAALHQADSDDSTPVDEIRRVVEEYGRYDQPNFASSLAAMKGPFLVSGPSRARTFKLTRPGWQQAAALVKQLGGPEQ